VERRVSSSEGWLSEVGFERDLDLGNLHRRLFERIVQLQDREPRHRIGRLGWHHAQKGRDRKREVFGIELFFGLHAFMFATDRNQRNSQAVFVVVVGQSVDFVVGNKFEVVEIIFVPVVALELDLESTIVGRGFDVERSAGA